MNRFLESTKVVSNIEWWILTVYGSIDLDFGKFYRVSLEFSEINYGAYLIVYWNYSGVAYTYLTGSNMYSPEYVSLSPYQITVTCQPGYAYSSTSSQWEPICGDGLKIGSEKWDDGNTISGDGWKGDCTSVESSWVWSGGSPTSRDNPKTTSYVLTIED